MTDADQIESLKRELDSVKFVLRQTTYTRDCLRAIVNNSGLESSQPIQSAGASDLRARFEACHELRHCDLERNKDGAYMSAATRCAWIAYQAALAVPAAPTVQSDTPEVDRLDAISGRMAERRAALCVSWDAATQIYLDIVELEYEGEGEREDMLSVTCEDLNRILARHLIAPSPQVSQQAPSLTELNEDLLDILGRPNFTCIRIAQRLREMGYVIKTRAENEQATVIHFLLQHYLEHGAAWREKATDALSATAARKEG